MFKSGGDWKKCKAGYYGEKKSCNTWDGILNRVGLHDDCCLKDDMCDGPCAAGL